MSAHAAEGGLQVGLGLWTMRATAALPASHPALYAALLEDAELADRLGYHSLWIAEHHLWYDGWCPAPLTAAAAALAVTSRLRVGTGIHQLPLYDPDAVGAEVEALHSSFGGRLEHGVGLGYRASEYDAFGLSRKLRGRRMDAALDRLIERRAGDGPTIWVGGFAEPVLRRIGKRGLSTMLPSTLGLAQISEAVAKVRAEAEAAGRTPGRIGVMKYAWLAGDEHERDYGERLLVATTEEYAGAWFPLRGRPGFQSPDLLERQTRRLLDTAVIGTPDDLVADLRALQRAGADLVVLHLAGDGRAEGRHRVMGTIAERVLPALGAEARA